MQKAQSTVEFLLAMSFIFIFFVAFIFIYQGQLVNFEQAQEKLKAAQSAARLAEAINSVYIAGEGSAYQLFIFDQLSNLSVSGNIVTAQSQNAFAQSRIITNLSNLSFVNNQVFSIKNTGGKIVISQQ